MEFWKKTTSGLKNALCTLSPNCKQAARLQSDALDRPLSPAKRFGLRLHLLICKWCRRYGKQIRLVRHAAHNHQEQLVETLPQKLSDAARERIKTKLRSESN